MTTAAVSARPAAYAYSAGPLVYDPKLHSLVTAVAPTATIATITTETVMTVKPGRRSIASFAKRNTKE
ncbi:hypothetical protein BRC86_08390 [Halobacteriales archaeon QS_3_64_16]|nr:MAG: hypothetical protein BRC86_08390 [Halobacteriales archaeon QS_3_64_16]